jgi:hypothetical protein
VAAARCREEEEQAKQPGRGGSIRFCSSATVGRREGKGGGDHAARHRAAGGAGVPDGAAWRPLGASARRGRARDGQRG